MNLRLRSCPNCGHVFKKTNLLCDFCWNHLSGRVGPFERVINQRINVNSLFDWRPDEDDLMSLTIMGLKSQEDYRLWIPFAKQILENDDWQGNFVVVPVGTGRVRNHSLGLARAISNLSGFQVQDVIGVAKTLAPTKSRFQTLSERTQTSSKKFYVKNTLSVGADQAVLVVDDVVTTGRSIESVQKLINMENKTKIWTLASRSLAV